MKLINFVRVFFGRFHLNRKHFEWKNIFAKSFHKFLSLETLFCFVDARNRLENSFFPALHSFHFTLNFVDHFFVNYFHSLFWVKVLFLLFHFYAIFL